MRALSSTTRTLGRSDDMQVRAHGADLDAAVAHVEADAASPLAAHRLAQNRDARGAEHAARREHVALAHLNRAGRDELAEHRRAARELGDETPRVGAQPRQALDQE